MTPALLLLEKIEPMDRHIVDRASVCVCGAAAEALGLAVNIKTRKNSVDCWTYEFTERNV